MTPSTEAGRRLLRMFATEASSNGHVRWPRAFDARLAERIVEELVPEIEAESRVDRGTPIKMGELVVLDWPHGQSWGRVTSIGGSSADPAVYRITVERTGPPIEVDE